MKRVLPLVLLAGALLARAEEKEVPLAGGGACGGCALDGGRLYVTHSPCVDVVDLAKGERVGQVAGVDGANAVAIVSEARRGFATAGRKNRLVVFDLQSLQGVKEVEAGDGVEGVLCVASTKEVWVLAARSRSITCIDPASLETKGRIPLNGRPSFAVEDAGKGSVYVCLGDKGLLNEIDAKKRDVSDPRPLAPGEAPTGMALDAARGTLYLGCAGNRKLVVLGLKDWRVTASADLGPRCGGIAFDAESGIVFAPCEDGVRRLRVAEGRPPEPLPPLAAPCARSCAIDVAAHRLYVVAGPLEGQAGTTRVLVFSAH